MIVKGLTVKEMTDALYEMGSGSDRVMFHVNGKVRSTMNVDSDTMRPVGGEYSTETDVDVYAEATEVREVRGGGVEVAVEF